MNYKHLNIEIPDLAKQLTPDGSGQRLYQTPNGKVYPSITTILAPIKKDAIALWKQKVGNQIADYETRWARERGTAIHFAIEELIKNKSLEGHPLLVRMLIEDLMPYLKKLNNIHCQEQVLYSDFFQTAGRCDCIAEYNKLLSIIDFKGSNRTKKEEWIKDYFLQTSFYAYAYYERTKRKIQQCVILIANESGTASEFIVKPWDYWKELKQIRNEYREKYHI